MAEADLERVLWTWTGAEVVGLLALAWLLWGSLFGGTGFLASVSRPLRLAGLALVAVQLLVPLLVYVDVRRRPDGPGLLWVHVAAMPVLNVVGLLGYLVERRRRDAG